MTTPLFRIVKCLTNEISIYFSITRKRETVGFVVAVVIQSWGVYTAEVWGIMKHKF